jgi:hypothetical protein
MKQLVLTIFILSLFSFKEGDIYFTNSGNVSFRSEAQQELIRASSKNMRALLDPAQRTFVFKVLIRTFKGFNSALQQEHFNEKYLESEKFPEATFSGKIIEDLDLSIDGVYDIRAKGMLNIHGIEMERIIKSKVNVSHGVIKIESNFSILLSDHNIKVPKVVHEKIASEIHVELNAELTKKE